MPAIVAFNIELHRRGGRGGVLLLFNSGVVGSTPHTQKLCLDFYRRLFALHGTCRIYFSNFFIGAVSCFTTTVSVNQCKGEESPEGPERRMAGELYVLMPRQ